MRNRAVATTVLLISLILFAYMTGINFIFQSIPYRYDGAFHLQTLNAWIRDTGFFNLRFWQTFTGFGEIRFLNYFPLPFLIAKVLSWLLPTNLAWNIVSFAPVWLLPVATYFLFQTFAKTAVRIDEASPKPLLSMTGGLLGASASFLFLYASESTFWGGGLIGQMYGMVGHGWALLIFILFVNELLKDDDSSLSKTVIFGALVTLSHVTVAMAIPFAALAHGLMFSKLPLRSSIKKSMIVLIGISCLTAFYWVPFLANLPYVFQVSARNGLYTFLQEEFVPLRYWVILASGLLVFIYSKLRFKNDFRDHPSRSKTIEFVFLVGIGPLVTTAILGIFWTRTLPLVYLTILLSCMMVFSQLLDRLQNANLAAIIKSILAVVLFGLAVSHGEIVAKQFDRNYAEATNLEASVSELQLALSKGSPFNRVEGAIPIGVGQNHRNYLFNWHTIPMYLKKPIASTLHVESSHTNPYWMYFRGLIGLPAYCYPGQMKCVTKSSKEPISKAMSFLGIDRIILIEESFKNLAVFDPDLFIDAKSPPWIFVGTKQNINLVDVIDAQDLVIHSEKMDFKNIAMEFQENFQAIMSRDKQNSENNANAAKWKVFTFGEVPTLRTDSVKACKPELKINQNSLEVHTNCPGLLHRIKFSYNPALSSSNAETLYAIDPGFIAMVPETENLTIALGDPWLWKISRWLSILAGIWLLVMEVFFRPQIKIGKASRRP